MIDATEIFRERDDEFLKFERIESPLHPCHDLCAFLLLQNLCPSNNMIAGSDHDIVYLDTRVEDLNEVATEEDIITLLRCGVFLSSESDCLVMFT